MEHSPQVEQVLLEHAVNHDHIIQVHETLVLCAFLQSEASWQLIQEYHQLFPSPAFLQNGASWQLIQEYHQLSSSPKWEYQEDADLTMPAEAAL
jgi:hypothetical protein